MKFSGRKSITFQLTALFAFASTVVMLSLGFVIGKAVDRHFVELDLEVLSGKLALVENAVEKIASKSDLEGLPQRLGDSLIGHPGLAVVVVASNGQKLYATDDSIFPSALLKASTKLEPVSPMFWRTADGTPFRGISAITFTAIKGLPPALVAVAIDISVHDHFNASFRLTLWIVVILAVLVTGFFGWIAARRGLVPLRAIKQKAADITVHQLHARLPIDAVPVELFDLVETLNDMLARLESSFKKLSDFSSDIAHELRTPVSNLLTQTQVTLSKERNPDEYRDILASNIEEFERLSRMISDMLFLAKSDNHLMIPHPEDLNLRDEVNELVDFYEALAEDKSITIGCTGIASASGDRLMLRRAISNLLSNAIRHTTVGGIITVRLGDSDESVVKISIENNGESIPSEHLPRLFDRFYRVDASRQHFAEGAGLGLAITQSIARAHGGGVGVRSAFGMTVFEITIPRGQRTTAMPGV